MTGSGFRVARQNQLVVHHGGHDGTEARSDPVDPLLSGKERRLTEQPGSDDAGGVHRSAGKRAAEQNVAGDRQADAEAPDVWMSRIDGGTENGKYKQEGKTRFDQDGHRRRHGGREIGCAQHASRNDVLAVRRVDACKDGRQQETGDRATEALRDNVSNGAARSDSPGHEHGDGDGWIEVASRDVHGGRDADRKSETVRDSDAEEAGTGIAHHGIGADGASADEAEHEGADGFGNAGLGVEDGLRHKKLLNRGAGTIPLFAWFETSTDDFVHDVFDGGGPMKLRLIAGRAGSGKTRHCLDAVRAELRASRMEGRRLLLVVPEQATLQMERALLGGGEFATLGRCEVLGFRRLARRILSEAGGPQPTVVSPLGRQMLLRQLIARSRPRLRMFESVADRAGFIAGLSQNIAELLEHHAEPVALRRAAEEAEAQGDPSAYALGDMAELLAAYTATLGDDRVDAESVLDAARQRLDGAVWLRGARVWLDGFAGFTPQQTRFLADLSRVSSCMELALLLDPDSDCVDDWESPVDALSLFARTERTWADVARAMQRAGVALDAPLRLVSRAMPRFRNKSLARLERDLFRVASHEGAVTEIGGGEIRIMEATDARGEVEAAAREVRRLTREVESPMRYRDIAIVYRDLLPYHDLISAELTAAGIPFFIDRRRPTAHHALVEWVRAAVRLHDTASFGAATVSLLKTGLLPLTEEQADLLDNHILARGIVTPDGWGEGPWRAALEAELPYAFDSEALLAARRAFLDALGAAFPTCEAARAMPVAQWVRHLDALMQQCGVQRRLAEWCETARGRGDHDEAQEHTQVWRDTIGLLDELCEMMGDESLRTEELSEVLDAGFAEFTLGLVPPTLDQVLVGSIDRSRHPPLRAVFVLGMTESLFPAQAAEDAILGDAERERLERSGVAIGPGRAARLADERMLAYVAATRASEFLWMSFPAADGEGRRMRPSTFLDDVKNAAPWVATESPRPPDPLESAKQAVTPGRFAASLATCVQSMGARAERVTALYEASRQSPGLRQAMSRVFSAFRSVESRPLPFGMAISLNEGRLSASVSRLESLSRCAFQHFARYGLRLTPRKTHAINALDLGTIYHEVLEQFFGGLGESGRTLRDLSPEEVADTLDATRQRLLPRFEAEMALSPATVRSTEMQLPRELLPVLDAQRNWPWTVKPVGTEVTFGGRDAVLPALIVQTPGGREVELHGTIDRIDLLSRGSDKLCFVFDYKRSRGRRLALDRVFHGIELQLLAYLLVLREHGKHLFGQDVAAAGTFFLPLLGGFQSVDHPADADKPGNDPARHFHPRGVLDFDWIDSIDPAYSGGRHGTFSLYRKTDGDMGEFDRTDAVRRVQLAALLDLVRRRLGELCDRWLDGDVAVLPRAVDGPLPCGQCDYSSVCRFEPRRDRVSILNRMTRSEVVQRAVEEAT